MAARVLPRAGSTRPRWRLFRGAPEKVAILDGLLALPRRYLRDLHRMVGRKPANARMHMLVAGGLLGSVLALVPAWSLPSRWAGLPLLALAAAMGIGVGLLARRRWIERAPELSAGAFDRLPFALAAMTAGFLLQGLGLVLDLGWPLALPGIALAVMGLAGVLTSAWPAMKHGLYGALHLAFHPRPGRFADQGGHLDTSLRPIALDGERLGVERPLDFAWNRLIGFEACVQCGRCETACPAFAAGQPLNPKKLIQDMALSQTEEADDRAYAGNGHPGRPAGLARGGWSLPLVGPEAMIHPDTLWSCTTCRACVEACPMFIEHVDAVVDLRRFQTLELGALPEKAAVALDELRATDTASGRSVVTRLDWAADLELPVLAERGRCDVLLWVGEGGFDLRNQRTLRALVRLMCLARLDVATLGEEELDCGDVARRLGDEATFQRLASANIATLRRYAFERIVTADPHALHVLRNEYPALGGRYEVLHHSQLLADLVAAGRLMPTSPEARRITYHDPCYLGRYNGEFAAPRSLLDAVGVDRVEMERSGPRSFCCGGGGGAALADIPGQRRIPDLRMEQARATGAEIVAVACPNCAQMLEGVVGPRPEIVDIAELLLAACEARP